MYINVYAWYTNLFTCYIHDFSPVYLFALNVTDIFPVKNFRYPLFVLCTCELSEVFSLNFLEYSRTLWYAFPNSRLPPPARPTHTQIHGYKNALTHKYIHTYRDTYLHIDTYSDTYIHRYTDAYMHRYMHASIHR